MYRIYSQRSLFLVLVLPALLLVLVALLFLLLLLLLVATFLLLTLLVLVGTLVTLLAHVGLRMPRAECRGRGHCVQEGVNVAWQFAEEIVNAPRGWGAVPCGIKPAGWLIALMAKDEAFMSVLHMSGVRSMNTPCSDAFGHGARSYTWPSPHRLSVSLGKQNFQYAVYRQLCAASRFNARFCTRTEGASTWLDPFFTGAHGPRHEQLRTCS
jgi:hypothetical protein